jgi:hypothetical protein
VDCSSRLELVLLVKLLLVMLVLWMPALELLLLVKLALSVRAM